MEVKYTITSRDYKRFNLFAQFRRQQYGNSLFYAVTFGSAFLVIFGFYMGDTWMSILKLLMIFYAVSAALYYLVLESPLPSLFKNNLSMFQEQTLIIKETGLREINAKADLNYSWRGIKDISQDKNSIYMFLDGNLGYVIPKRAFRSPDEATKFFRLATLYWTTRPDVNQ